MTDRPGRLPDIHVRPLDGIGHPPSDYREQVHVDDVDSLDALIDLADDPRAHAILRVRDADGGWRLVDHRPRGQSDDGAVTLLRRDVTGRERALERAGKTESYWRTILRHGHESIAVLDPEHLTIRHASDHLGTVLGREPYRLLGSRAVWHVDHRDLDVVRKCIASFDETVDAAAIHTLELRLRRRGLPSIWMEAVVSDARSDPEVGALVVNLREIGDRKRAEEQLRSSEQLFRVLVQHVADGAIVVDTEHRISFVSPRAAAVLGAAEADLLGGPLPLTLASDGLRLGGPVVPGAPPLELLPAEARGPENRWYEIVGHDLTADPVVAGWVLVLRDVTDRRDRVESLRRQVESDPLTGLGNRRGFERLVARHLGDGRDVGIGFLDLDGFKAVNDVLGHAAGDALLIQVGRRLGGAVRPSDLVARFGGDEFVVALVDMPNHEQLVRLTSRIAERVAGTYEIAGHAVRVGVSAGWSMATPGTSVADALHRADRRMYLHKHNRA